MLYTILKLVIKPEIEIFLLISWDTAVEWYIVSLDYSKGNLVIIICNSMMKVPTYPLLALLQTSKTHFY